MHYEINVSKDGTHVFATHERSITSMQTLQRVAPVIYEKFPASEGYKVEVTLYEGYGSNVPERDWLPKEKLVKRTIMGWCNRKGIQMLDPDGFDRTDEKIWRRRYTEAEFDKRIVHCTTGKMR